MLPRHQCIILFGHRSVVQQKELKVQQKMLSTWITQLYLQRFIYMDGSEAEAVDDAHRRFTRFLEENRDTLDKATTYQLLSGHGRDDDILLFAGLPKDMDVQVKLPAFHRTTIVAECKGNRVVRLEVEPPERRRDVVLLGCPPPDRGNTKN